MEEFKADDCKNLQGHQTRIGEEYVFICTTMNCADRKDCDGKIIDRPPVIHFEQRKR